MLSLYHNSIDDEICLLLADVISNNNTLQRLTLDGNELSDEGVIALSAALSINNTLKILSLTTNNKVGDEGVKV